MKLQSEEIKVFISNRESTCGECGENLGSKAWVTLAKEKGALCLACADLDHLLFLPSGDAVLTRRARKYSILSAVVLKWSHGRKRYERQGLLIEAQGLEKAEEECLADSEIRKRRREREAVRREELDRSPENPRESLFGSGCQAGNLSCGQALWAQGHLGFELSVCCCRL